MKTRIKIKGDNKQVREFASVVANTIENNPSYYSNVITGEPEYTKFYEVIRRFVVLQPDRRGVDVRELLSDAKELADSKEVEYDALSFNIVDD